MCVYCEVGAYIFTHVLKMQPTFAKMSGETTNVPYGEFDMFDTHKDSSDEEVLEASQVIEYLHDLDILENVSNYATLINFMLFCFVPRLFSEMGRGGGEPGHKNRSRPSVHLKVFFRILLFLIIMFIVWPCWY